MALPSERSLDLRQTSTYKLGSHPNLPPMSNNDGNDTSPCLLLPLHNTSVGSDGGLDWSWEAPPERLGKQGIADSMVDNHHYYNRHSQESYAFLNVVDSLGDLTRKE